MSKTKKTKTTGYKFTKTRIIIFLILCAVLAATLPFSSFFEEKIDAYLTKDIGEYATAIESDLVVHVIDVGNADCIAIEFPDGTKGLIDCGVSTGSLGKDYQDKAISYIKNNIFDSAENGTFDFFILTHQDADHCNNATKIFDNFQFKKIYRPAMFYYKTESTSTEQETMNDAEFERAKAMGFVSNSSATSFADTSGIGFSTSSYYLKFLQKAYSETYDGGTQAEVVFNYTGTKDSENNTNVIENETYGYILDFLSPNKLKYTENNDYSPMMILTYQGRKICLTGDAEEGVEEYLVQEGILEDVDVLKVGHHGGDTSSKTDFLSALKPEYAFISCNNSDNKYGHPNSNVLTRLKEAGVLEERIYTTKDNGSLIFAVNKSENSSVGEMLIATSDGAILVSIKWWYVCGTVLVVGAGLIFGIGSGKKRKKASK